MHAGCLCDGFIKNRGMPGLCARCKHRTAEHSSEVEDADTRTARRAEEGERAKQELLAQIKLAQNRRGELRAQRWREMLPIEDWKAVTLRKTEAGAQRLTDDSAPVDEFRAVTLRSTPQDTRPALSESVDVPRSLATASFGKAAPVTEAPPSAREEGPEAAAFLRFLDATDIVTMQQALQECCELCGLAPYATDKYSALKRKLLPQLKYADRQIFDMLDKKMQRPATQDASALRVAVVGAGPVGLRTALELALCGAQVWIIEKRQHFSRLNILHLWEWVCSDLLALGATGADIMGRSFYHIGTCHLQLILAQAVLVLGGQLFMCSEYHGLVPPDGQSATTEKATMKAAEADEEASTDETVDVSDGGVTAAEGVTHQPLWSVRVARAENTQPTLLPVHAVIAAGGANDPVLADAGFACRELKGKEALGVVSHFKNTGKAGIEEFSWASQFNKPMFAELRAVGIDLENVVHYEGATHYFVCTPTKECLVSNGVLPSDGDLAQVDAEQLRGFMRKIATFYRLPEATPCLPQPHGAALFDFSKRSNATEAAKYLVADGGVQLAVLVVGDALMEPFWPEGLGVNRGFLSALDAVWLLTNFHRTGHTTDVNLALSKRAELLEKLRQLSAFTKDNLLKPEFGNYALLPSSRYKLFSE